MEQEQEPICLHCGDRGYTNSFVYCVKCLHFAVHRYCLNVIPQTVDEFVPWLCDDCDVKTTDPSTSKHVQGDSASKNKGKCVISLESTSSSSHDEESDRFGDEMASWIEALAALEDASRKTTTNPPKEAELTDMDVATSSSREMDVASSKEVDVATRSSKEVDAATSNSATILNVIVSLETQLMECKKKLCRAENEVKRVTEENVRLKKALHLQPKS